MEDPNKKKTIKKDSLSHERNKKKVNSLVNKNISVNNYAKNNANKKGVFAPVVLNRKNIKLLKNFNMTIFNLSAVKKANSLSKEKKIKFDIYNNNKNNKKTNAFQNRNVINYSNAIKSKNSRNVFDVSIKNKGKNMVNIVNKLYEKSCNIDEKLNISKNSRSNYDKMIKIIEG